MISSILICLGLVIIVVGALLFINKKRLYKEGVRTIGKVVGIETYTYLTPGTEFNTLYYTGITPIIEVKDNGEKVRVAYSSLEDYSNISEGDDVEVIYPKGKVEELIICNEKELYKGPLTVVIVGILISILALVLVFL